MIISISDFIIDITDSQSEDGSILYVLDISFDSKHLNCIISTDDSFIDYDIFCSIDSDYSQTQLSIIKFLCNSVMRELLDQKSSSRKC